MAAGLALRLAFWSGLGLGDDVLFRSFIVQIAGDRGIQPGNFAYRFTWWLPTVISARLLGTGDAGLVAPITAAAVAGIGVVYTLGRHLFGRAGAVIAAALLVVQPLDVAWSTMLANDVYFSLFAAATMLAVLRALEPDTPDRRRRRWLTAGVLLWLTYHAKVSAPALVPAIALVVWGRRRAIDAGVGTFVATAAVLFGASALVAYGITGDPLIPLTSELSAQGLLGPESLTHHRLTPDVFWAYPRVLFGRNHLGDRLFSVQPHVLVAAALLGPLLGLRSSLAVAWWLLAIVLAMELNVQRYDGVWIAGFRNVRHTHVFVYPTVLLLAGYLASLRTRAPRLGALVVAALLAVSTYDSVSVARKTHVAFDDRRRAVRFLETLPPRTIYGDFALKESMSLHGTSKTPAVFLVLEGDADKRRTQLARLAPGYVVTGGAREPYYGCPWCIPQSEELDPQKWKLLREFSGPSPTPWRPEPVRIWEATQ
jgi:hypothetical protein